MTNEVLSFIRRRFTKDCNWTNGNCYWFSLILSNRFLGGVICYKPITGHFVYLYDNHYFDWNGIADDGEEAIPLHKIRDEDPLFYSSLVRDCIS